MDIDDSQAIPPTRHTGVAVKIALVAAGLAAGAIGATAIGASATTSGTGSTSSSTSTTAPNATAGSKSETNEPRHEHGSAPVRGDEKVLSTADSDRIKAAALKAVPGGTVYRIETDAGDGVYEAHMTKADGSEVTVKFDKNFAVTKVESGMGQGDPRPANAPNGPPGGH